MASAEFSEAAEARRPTVQVGDPFTEKLLLEACLDLMQTKAIVAIQDMGAAGLTSSSFEMAARGGTGIEMDLDRAGTPPAAAAPDWRGQVQQGLVGLGWSTKEADKAVAAVADEAGDDPDVGALLRSALRMLSRA
jgi:hypothetical protein